MSYPVTDDTSGGYAGLIPSPAPWNDWNTYRRFWIGNAGAMVQLPDPGVEGYTVSQSRGRVTHQLIGGATAISEQDEAAREWTFAWLRLPPRDRAVVEYLDSGNLGAPPWCFLPPDDTNRLTDAQSRCVAGWTPTSGTVAPYTAVAAPYAPSGVLEWSGQSSGARLVAGLVVGGSGVPDLDHGIPNIPAEPTVSSLWARAVTGTASVNLRVTDLNGDGTGSTTHDDDDVALTTAWTWLAFGNDPGAFAAPWLLPSIRSNDGASILIANADFRFTTEPDAWLPGCGVPQVNPTGDLDWTIDQNLNAAGSYTLAEAVLGAV